MEKTQMLNHIKRFRGSSTWICGQLKVSKSALSHWLHGRKNNARLDAEVPPLVRLILQSGGACIFEINGKSVRSQIAKIRRTRSKRQGGTK